MHADGFSGPCIRDDLIVLKDPCADGTTVLYQKSQGYRQVAGDVCQGGAEAEFSSTEAVCCSSKYSVVLW